MLVAASTSPDGRWMARCQAKTTRSQTGGAAGVARDQNYQPQHPEVLGKGVYATSENLLPYPSDVYYCSYQLRGSRPLWHRFSELQQRTEHRTEGMGIRETRLGGSDLAKEDQPRHCRHCIPFASTLCIFVPAARVPRHAHLE